MELIDPELLRTFLAIADGGSLAKAANSVGRSPSAITAQMQRLEALVGEPLLQPHGRGRVLTRAGEEFAGHARRILSAHRDAYLSMMGARADGHVRLAATQDFANAALPALLREFAMSFARVTLDLRIGRTSEMVQAYTQGEIDVLICLRSQPNSDEALVLRTQMIWLASSAGHVRDHDEVPLALLDAPCGFRTAALASLDRAGRRYRVVATSPSLAGLMTAVDAGLAVTLRTRHSLCTTIIQAPATLDLPDAGHAEFTVRLRADAPKAATSLTDMLCEGLAGD
jgi:DNA-binding transcriptional LysR family regulator